MAGKWRFSSVVVLVLALSSLAVATASGRREGNATQATSQATVKVAQSKLGRILVDGRGRPLYVYMVETSGSPVCSTDDHCTTLWLPLLTKGKPHAGQGVSTRLLGTVQRTKPSGLQVTYNGHPLYRYQGDTKAGDTGGQGFYSNWYVLSPKGAVIKKSTY